MLTILIIQFTYTTTTTSIPYTDGGEGGTINTEETASATHNLVTASSKAHKAMDIIGEKIEQNAKIAAFQEIKISTEIMLGLSI